MGITPRIIHAPLLALALLGGPGCSGESAPCETQGTSTLPGVSIEVTTSECNYTLEETKEDGISIEYEVVVDADIPNVFPRSQEYSCLKPGPSGLMVFAELAGGEERYCLCDRGLCPPPSANPVTVVRGAHPASFLWYGRNWNGPSDTANSHGDPFPAGHYTLTLSAVGDVDDAGAEVPFRVERTFVIHLWD